MQAKSIEIQTANEVDIIVGRLLEGCPHRAFVQVRGKRTLNKVLPDLRSAMRAMSRALPASLNGEVHAYCELA